MNSSGMDQKVIASFKGKSINQLNPVSSKQTTKSTELYIKQTPHIRTLHHRFHPHPHHRFQTHSHTNVYAPSFSPFSLFSPLSPSPSLPSLPVFVSLAPPSFSSTPSLSPHASSLSPSLSPAASYPAPLDVSARSHRSAPPCSGSPWSPRSPSSVVPTSHSLSSPYHRFFSCLPDLAQRLLLSSLQLLELLDLLVPHVLHLRLRPLALLHRHGRMKTVDKLVQLVLLLRDLLLRFFLRMYRWFLRFWLVSSLYWLCFCHFPWIGIWLRIRFQGGRRRFVFVHYRSWLQLCLSCWLRLWLSCWLRLRRERKQLVFVEDPSRERDGRFISAWTRTRREGNDLWHTWRFGRTQHFLHRPRSRDSPVFWNSKIRIEFSLWSERFCRRVDSLRTSIRARRFI